MSLEKKSPQWYTSANKLYIGPVHWTFFSAINNVSHSSFDSDPRLSVCLSVAAVSRALCQDQYCSANEFCGEHNGGTTCLCRALFAAKYKPSKTLGTVYSTAVKLVKW